MAHQVFTHTLRVTYAECTVGNHVYYARYLDYLEEARGEFFRSLDMPLQSLQEQGVIFPVTEVQVQYRGPARYDDVIRVEVWLTLLRGVRLAFACRVLNADHKLLLEAKTIHACTNLEEKPIRIPAAVIAKLEAFVVKESEA